jgi:hypothetical protein
MPTRFLSDEQRRRYGRHAGEPTGEQLDRYFHLDEADRALIARLRDDHDQLGFALRLGTVRFPGTFLDDPADVPPPVLTTMAGQLGLRRPPGLDSYRHGRQRWRHVALIRDRYGYRDFALDGRARFRLTRWDRGARISGADALTPTLVRAHATRMHSGRPSSSIRFRVRTATVTSVAWRRSVRERSASPITRL